MDIMNYVLSMHAWWRRREPMPGRRKNGGETIFTFYADECRAQNKSMAEIPKLGVRLLQVANGCEHGGAVPGARGGRGEVGAGDI